MDLQAYTVEDFVEASRISRSALYKLWTGGLGHGRDSHD